MALLFITIRFMKKLFSLVTILVLIFAVGCTQAPQTTSDVEDPEAKVAEEEAVEAIPEDFVGVWLRTGTYLNGGLEHHEPATWTLNNTNYTSTGTCINTGKVMYEGDNTVSITLDSTSCPNVPTGGTVAFTYEIALDEERDVEVMTVYTGPMMETYDRQS